MINCLPYMASFNELRDAASLHAPMSTILKKIRDNAKITQGYVNFCGEDKMVDEFEKALN